MAPNAKLRQAVIASAGPPAATLQLLQEAQEKMGLQDTGAPTDEDHSDAEEKPKSTFHLAAARCWALLLVRIYECFPLSCPKCFSPMRIIAFIEEPATVEKILE